MFVQQLAEPHSDAEKVPSAINEQAAQGLGARVTTVPRPFAEKPAPSRTVLEKPDALAGF